MNAGLQLVRQLRQPEYACLIVDPATGLMLDYRLRRWPNIKPALGQRLMWIPNQT